MKKRFVLIISCLIMLYSCNKQKTEFKGFTYPKGKYKALIMSYDDGTSQDIKLVALFNKNNIVGTFNLNSGILGTKRGWKQKGKMVYQKYVSKDSLNSIYKNHEISAHGAFHKNFTNISDNELLEEVKNDIITLEKQTGQKIVSLAYPFGSANAHVAKLVASTGINNARTVNDTHSFDLPNNFLLWNPTTHDSKALDDMQRYLELDNQNLSLFYVWGHSWELDDEKRWENMTKFCQAMGKETNIWFVGSGEYTAYLQALNKVEIKDHEIINPKDNQTVWVHLSNGVRELKSGERIEISVVKNHSDRDAVNTLYPSFSNN